MDTFSRPSKDWFSWAVKTLHSKIGHNKISKENYTNYIKYVLKKTKTKKHKKSNDDKKNIYIYYFPSMDVQFSIFCVNSEKKLQSHDCTAVTIKSSDFLSIQSNASTQMFICHLYSTLAKFIFFDSWVVIIQFVQTFGLLQWSLSDWP